MKVTLDGQFTVEAERISPTRWNGFACPYFTREQAAEVVSAVNALYAESLPDERMVYAFEGDDVVERFHADAEPSRRNAETDRWAPDTDGLYSIGAFSWVWSEAWDETHTEHSAECIRSGRSVLGAAEDCPCVSDEQVAA